MFQSYTMEPNSKSTLRHVYVIWNLKTSHRITGFLDFVQGPVFYKLENTTFRNLDLSCV
jgi:hypothetical protein